MFRSFTQLTRPNHVRARMFSSFSSDAPKNVTRTAGEFRVNQNACRWWWRYLKLYSACLLIVYGFKLDQFESSGPWVKEWSTKIRAFPGVKNLNMSVCGQGRMAVTYDFTNIDAFKAYMGSDLYKEVVASMEDQPFLDKEKGCLYEYVGMVQHQWWS